MSTVDVVVVNGDKVSKKGSAELPAELFDVQVNVPLIHQVVVAQQAAARPDTGLLSLLSAGTYLATRGRDSPQQVPGSST